MIRLSGIFRSVYLYSTPAVHLRDFTLDTPLSDDYTAAELSVTASVRDYGGTGSRAATPSRPSSTTPTGTPSGRVRSSRPSRSAPARRSTVQAAKAVPAPKLWSAEHPNLYTAVLRLRDPAGKVIETLSPPGRPARVRASRTG